MWIPVYSRPSVAAISASASRSRLTDLCFSSSLTFWLPVLIMITLNYQIYREARRHLASMRARQFSLPAMMFSSAIPSMCSIGEIIM